MIHNFWLSVMQYFIAIIGTLSVLIYMSKIRNFKIELTGVLGTKNMEIFISIYVEDV